MKSSTSMFRVFTFDRDKYVIGVHFVKEFYIKHKHVIYDKREDMNWRVNFLRKCDISLMRK